MFKRALGIVAILGLVNVMLYFQQSRFFGDNKSCVYAQHSESLLGYLVGIFDEDVKAGTAIPQKAAGRFLAAHSLSVPSPTATFSGNKPVAVLLISSVKIPTPDHHNLFGLFPENQNYLFRLKPF